MRGSLKILNADFNCSMDSGFVDITMNEPLDVSHIAPAPFPQLSSHKRIKQEKESSTWQGQKGKLEKMFDRLFADSRGQAWILDWCRPHAIAYVSDTVSNEMDMVKEALHETLDSMTPDYNTVLTIQRHQNSFELELMWYYGH
ncbi:hypothetical protein BDR07DRAFT_1403107 [Suillus spraguei]|nr:hypothetical protein BDR07DRAFT_1403107 [Suillus spraguei]